MRPAQAALAAALREHAIQEGEFTLASGRTSNWYLDGRQVTFRGDCIEIVGDAIVEALGRGSSSTRSAASRSARCRSAGGRARHRHAQLRGAQGGEGSRRRRAHGRPGRARRPRARRRGHRDDRGSACSTRVDAILEFGCEIVAASLLLDRGGELGAALEARGIPYFPVLGAPDFGYEFGS